MPLSTVARKEEARGWSGITHVDGQRTVTEQADVNTRIGNADAIVAELQNGFLPRLAAATPGLSFDVDGQSANSAETVASILRGFLIGLIGIHVVLSFQFRSYVEPVIVMMAIPLAFIGVILGHLIMGYNISMASLIGAASLAGIVVNNSILLVQVIKRHVGEGMDVARAAGQASRERFRPILMSVSTTMMGLVPLLLEGGTQAQTLKAMVLAVAILTAFSVKSDAQQSLTADEVSAQIVGHSFHGRKGILSVTLQYAKDGSMTMQTPIGSGAGTWVMSGSQLCVTLTSGPRKGSECLTFTRQSDGRYQGSNGIRLTLIK